MCNDVDVLGVSESWLNSEIDDAIIQIPGFDSVRCDSSSGIRKHGVLVYVINSLKFEVITSHVLNLICIYLIDFRLYCINVYRPPSSTDEENSLLLTFLGDFCDSSEVCVLGDFNLPSLDWTSGSPTNNYNTPVDRQFLDCFTSVGLTQMINEPTNFPSCTTIDLCLVTDEERVGQCEVLPPLPQCTHGPIKMLYTYQQFEDHIPMGPETVKLKVRKSGIVQTLRV